MRYPPGDPPPQSRLDLYGDQLSQPTETRGTESPLPPDEYGARLARSMRSSWDWLVIAARLPAKAFALPSAGAAGLIYSGRCILTGVSVTNNATVGFSVTIYDGMDITGLQILRLGGAAGANVNVAVPNVGVLAEIGLVCNSFGAAISGVAYVVPLQHYPFTPPGT